MMRLIVMATCCVMMLSGSLLAEDAKTDAPSKPSFEEFAAVVQTNIFIRRKPVPKRQPSNKTTQVSTTVQAPAPPVNTYLLCGIIIENDSRFTAMIEDSQTHTLRTLHINDKLDVFEIPAMSISSIHLNLPDGQSVELFIGQTIDANGQILQSAGWVPTSSSATPGESGSSAKSDSATSPPSEKELSILEKLRRKRESQLKKD